MADNGQLRVAIIGTGPVGSILAVHLVEAGASVVLCDNFPNRIDAIREKGIKLTHTIEKHAMMSDACCSVQELAMFEPDLAVVAVKTPDLPKVIGQLKEIDTGKMSVMCAQNGIDNEVEVGRLFGDERALRMVINFAGNMSSDHVAHVSFFHPPNYVAALADGGNALAERFAGMLTGAGLQTVVPDDIQDYVWEKAILNASLSALCAVSRRTMKDVMDFPWTLEIVEGIIDESVRVAEMERIDLNKKFRRYAIRYLKNAGHHRPSMLVDLENGNPTEVDQLNGKIVEYGRKHCLPTPLNLFVTSLIHLMEHTSRRSRKA